MEKPGPTGQEPRIEGVVLRGREIAVTVDGRSIRAYEGESLAAALFAAGHHVFRRAPRTGEPRGPFCGMGICFDCVLTVDGKPNVRACQTLVQDGMRVESQMGNGTWNLRL